MKYAISYNGKKCHVIFEGKIIGSFSPFPEGAPKDQKIKMLLVNEQAEQMVKSYQRDRKFNAFIIRFSKNTQEIAR